MSRDSPRKLPLFLRTKLSIQRLVDAPVLSFDVIFEEVDQVEAQGCQFINLFHPPEAVFFSRELFKLDFEVSDVLFEIFVLCLKKVDDGLKLWNVGLKKGEEDGLFQIDMGHHFSVEEFHHFIGFFQVLPQERLSLVAEVGENVLEPSRF